MKLIPLCLFPTVLTCCSLISFTPDVRECGQVPVFKGYTVVACMTDNENTEFKCCGFAKSIDKYTTCAFTACQAGCGAEWEQSNQVCRDSGTRT